MSANNISSSGGVERTHDTNTRPTSTSTTSIKKRKFTTHAPSPSISTASLPQARRDDEDDDDGGEGSQADGKEKRTKRNRVHFSCVECHRRKQKCDRNEPCGQCVLRKVPHLCRPFINGVEDPVSFDADVRARLTRIETMLFAIIPSNDEASSRPQGGSSQGQPGTTSESNTNGKGSRAPGYGIRPAMEGILSAGEEVFHPGRRGGDMDVDMDFHAPVAIPVTTSTPPIPLTLHPASSAFTRRRITLDPPSKEVTTILQTLSESGIEKNSLVALLMSVPDKGMADSLTELYFREIDWTRYKLNRPSFFRRYLKFFDLLDHHSENPPLDADMLKWLPLMFIVLAIATLSAPVELWGGEAGQKSWSRRFYASSRSALTYAKALQRDNLDVVFAGLLTARYMLLSRRAAEGSIPLTSAFQLGLYRDGSILNLSSKREVELRRRAFAGVYHLDRTTALLVGRPTAISDAHTDTKEPCNRNDDDLDAEGFDGVGLPMTVPTEYTQTILRHRLAQIMGRIADHTFAIRPPDYATVLNLDQELLTWQTNLPAFFSFSNPDTSLDNRHHYLFVQRHILATEYYFARITLHRPYLLRKPDRDNQYLYSIEAAIESAKSDLLARREFQFQKPVDLKVNSGGYRVLNSYIVLGVFIKMDPNSTRADELRKLLDVVAGQALDEQGRISEPIVKDEMAIVDFLTAKANSNSSLRNSAPIPPYSHILPELRGPGKEKSVARDASAGRARAESTSQQNIQLEQDQMSRASWQSPDSAWSFVAPGMAQIDVHQPFGGSNPVQRLPRPLRPPRSTRQRSDSGASNASPPTGSMVSMPQGTGYQGHIYQSSPNQPQVSPLRPAESLLRTAFDVNTAASDNDAEASSSGLGQEFQPMYDAIQDASLNLFSDPWLDGAYAMLGMGEGAQGGPSGDVDFNPFALSQFGQADGKNRDGSEAAFLNHLVSTIANSNSSLAGL